MRYQRDSARRVRVNERIRIPKIRLIDDKGEQVGVISTREALQIARSKDMDLVEIAPNVRPPVCKIMDYGKYLYQEKQKQKLRRQKSQKVKLKELKIGVKIQEHDYQTKLKFAREFLQSGNKLKIRIFFKGREIVHHEMGKQLMDRISEDLSHISRIEIPPKMEGRQMVMQLVTLKGVKNAKAKE